MRFHFRLLAKLIFGRILRVLNEFDVFYLFCSLRLGIGKEIEILISEHPKKTDR